MGEALARVWSSPNSETFAVPAIREFVMRYAKESALSLDPFARNSRIASITNDLDPETSADHHMDALEFLRAMRGQVSPDLVLFDPPYSLRQLKESYGGVGRDFVKRDGWKPNRWSEERDIIAAMVRPGGHVLSFGWNSSGMGKSRGFSLVECLLVCHGPGHHDTICISEVRSPESEPNE